MSAGAKKTAESSMDLAALAEIVERFSGKKIVLFGDFVADEFQFGEISRVSREAPVLILRHRGTNMVPGGGANAAKNLAALGAKVIPLTVVGDDAGGAALTESFRARGVDSGGNFLAGGGAAAGTIRFCWGGSIAVGTEGMLVFERAGKKLTQIPVHGSDQAVDVTGAGDTVLAAFTLGLASGASALEAAQIANIAGGLVVMKRGTAVVTRAELLAAIRAEASGGGS